MLNQLGVSAHQLNQVPHFGLLLQEKSITDQLKFIIKKYNFAPKVCAGLLCKALQHLIPPEIKAIVMDHADPIALLQVLVELSKRDNFLTAANFKVIVDHPNSIALADMLQILWDANLLTSANFKVVVKHPNPVNLVYMLHVLRHVDLLTSENFEAVRAKLAQHYLKPRIYFDKEIFTDRNLQLKVKALVQLSSLVHEVAINYLSGLANPQTTEELRKFTQLITRISEEECVSVIWDQIKSEVADRLFKLGEGNSFYKGKADPKFIDLVDSGRRVKFKDLSGFQQRILGSSGYHQYCSQMLRHPAGFFPARKAAEEYLSEHRHDNATAQQKYDQQFGLVLSK